MKYFRKMRKNLKGGLNMHCVACNKKIRFWHKHGINSSWHQDCWISWDKGYKIAMKFCLEENRIAGLTDPVDLYKKRMKYEVH